MNIFINIYMYIYIIMYGRTYIYRCTSIYMYIYIPAQITEDFR